MNRTIKCPDCDRRKSRFNDATTVRYSKIYDERIPNSDTIKALAETCDPLEYQSHPCQKHLVLDECSHC